MTAKKAGNATITAKIGKKKYTCKIKVKDAVKSNYEALAKYLRKWGDRTDEGGWEVYSRRDGYLFSAEYIENMGIPKTTAQNLTRSTLNLMLLGIEMDILSDADLTWKDLGFKKF